MARKTTNLNDLYAMLANAKVRECDNDFMVRMDGRKEVAALQKRILKAENFARREDELNAIDHAANGYVGGYY